MIASTLANIHRDRNTDRFKPADFMPEFTDAQPLEDRTPEEIANEVDAVLGTLVATQKPK